MNSSIFYFLILSLLLFSCRNEPTETSDNADTTVFTDARDQQTYPFTQIGERIWMTENLKYQDTDRLSHCVALDSSCSQYGNYYQRTEIQNICPKGWRIPNLTDIRNLIGSLDGTQELDLRGGKKVEAAALEPLKLQMSGVALATNDTLDYRGLDYMAVWHTTADTVFEFSAAERKNFNGTYAIGLHIYPANESRDSFMVEPTYDKGGQNYLSCRCVKE